MISSSGRPSSRSSRHRTVQTPRRTPRTYAAPPTPHVSPALVSLDSFYALHRPLLELPINLSARRSVSTPQPALSQAELDSRQAELEREAIEQFVRAVDLSKGDYQSPQHQQLAQSTATATVESTTTEAIPESEQEDDLLDPSSSWVEDAGEAHSSQVRQYLASRTPFSSPPPPHSVRASTDKSASPDVSYLRPFRIRNLPQDSLTPASAFDMATSFLSSAQAMNAWKAHEKASPILEQLERARSKFSGDHQQAASFTGRRKRGHLRVWTEKDGWQTVDVLPAEMVDLDWVDEQTEQQDVVVQVDSVRRKRKKAMKKHKYKKRRKAQRALRQRLDK